MPDKFPKYIGKEKFVMHTNRKPVKIPENFETVLPVVAASSDLGWRKSEEGIYLVRSNRWYGNDAAIVPEAKLMEWRKRLEANKVRRGETYALQTVTEVRQMLDLDSEIVNTLSKWQIAQGLLAFFERVPADPAFPDDEDRWIRPFADWGGRIMRRYHTLMWYSNLSDPFKTLLVEGRLPVSALNAVQRDGLDFLLPDIALADPDRPLFLGIRPIMDAKRSHRTLVGREEGGYDNRGGVELYLISAE